MKILICLLFMCGLNATMATAQTSPINKDSIHVGLSESELKRATELFVAMTKTDESHLFQQCLKKFKTGLNNYKPEFIEGRCIKWIEQNFDKTKFASIEEAAELENKLAALDKQIWDANAELDGMLTKASREQFPIIMATFDDYYQTLK